MKKYEPGIPDEIYAVIGRVVTGLLTPDNVIHLQEITDRLHRLSEETHDMQTRCHCLKVIKMLTRKMH